MNSIKAFGKFLDQPILISKLDKAMPKLITGVVLAKTAYDVCDTFIKTKDKSKEEKLDNYKKIFKKTLISAFAVASAVNAPKIAGFITKRQPIQSLSQAQESAKNIVDEFVSNNKTDNSTLEILNRAKSQILSYSDIKKMSDKLEVTDKGKEFLNKLIPEPQNIKAKDIFSEIGYLSIYGAVPVVGGISGGVAADVIVGEDAKKNLPDKISEGVYQYLANIFLCNVGAGAALGLLEKAKITSKAARAVGMTAGIILTGIVAGSKIANLISKKFINPLISPNKKIKERKPEAVDMCMHTDDIATVSVLSGLKWIEPSLPILYSLSGYKAGIGYRN